MPAPKLRVAATKRPTPAESSRPADAPLTTAQRIVLPAYENIALVLDCGSCASRGMRKLFSSDLRFESVIGP